MTMTCDEFEIPLVLLAAPSLMELQPIYREIPAARPVRSDSEKRCAAMMLEKLRREEDHGADLPSAYDSGQVIDKVVERVIKVLNAGQG